VELHKIDSIQLDQHFPLKITKILTTKNLRKKKDGNEILVAFFVMKKRPQNTYF
jgi:hypothetical protein